MDPDFEWVTYRQKQQVVDFWWSQQDRLCCICKDPDLPMDEYHRDADRNPLAASLEHLIPKVDGGRNTVGNTRLAHRMCNNALGGLASHNEHRALMSLPPMSVEWALARVREQWARLISARRAGLPYIHLIDETKTKKNPLGLKRERPRSPTIKWSMIRTVPNGGLPRGATLPGYVAAEEAVHHPKVISARKPSAAFLDRKARPGRRIVRPVCIACDGNAVTMDASLKWSEDLQAWVISAKHDRFDCETCQADAKVRWETIC